MIQRTSIPTLLYATSGLSVDSDSATAQSPERAAPISVEAVHTALVTQWQQQDPFWSTISSEHADISHIADSSQAPTIMQIRAFSNELEYPPHQLQKKLFIIWRLDEASIAAQNAILKNLEEPPAYADIIITVKNPAWVLETIQSRSKSTALNINRTISQQFAQKNDEKSPQATQQVVQDMLSIDFWQSQTLGELIQIAGAFKTKDDALQLLDQITQTMLNHPTYPQPFMTKAIDQFQQAYFKIKGNANVALQLENCFFTIKQACWQS
jgi:hypothetical protein